VTSCVCPSFQDCPCSMICRKTDFGGSAAWHEVVQKSINDSFFYMGITDTTEAHPCGGYRGLQTSLCKLINFMHVI